MVPVQELVLSSDLRCSKSCLWPVCTIQSYAKVNSLRLKLRVLKLVTISTFSINHHGSF